MRITAFASRGYKCQTICEPDVDISKALFSIYLFTNYAIVETKFLAGSLGLSCKGGAKI